LALSQLGGFITASLDPNKDVEASIKSIENGLTTRHRATRELNGGDFVENMETLIEEQELMESLKPNNNIEVKNGN